MRFKIFGRTISINAERTSGAMSAAEWENYLIGNGYQCDALTAIRIGAVFRCVDLLSKTMASLPMHMYKKTRDGAKEKAGNHPVYPLVYILPNHCTTAYEFWQMFTANILLTDGGYAKIVRNGAGEVVELWNIPTRNVVYRDRNRINGQKYIDIVDSYGNMERLREGDFLYVPGFRFDSDTDPMDPISIAADILGLSTDINAMAAAVFRNGANPGGFLEVPGGLSDRAYERLKEDAMKKYSGVKNAGKLMILEEGMKANMLDRDLEKTQVLESRKFAIEEICRIFGVPLHLCMSLEHATFSNIEQQSAEFVRDAINPLSVRIEQAMYRDLLTPRERGRYFFKFNTNALLRGDTAARTSYYNTMRQNGVMCADDIRELEDMNAIPDGSGKIYAINGNMIDLKNVPLNIPKGAQTQKGATANAKV